MKVLVIAKVAHAINAAYCASLGDNSQTTWDEAPEWQQNSAINGVQMHLANPDATPEQSHESWLNQKLAEGWKYGPEKDETKKEHPCCVPYADLPPEQKAKDYLFRGVVHALKDIQDGDDAQMELLELQDQLNELQATHNALLARSAAGDFGVGAVKEATGMPVRYIGPRESWFDRLYGSGLGFIRGQVRCVPGDLARRFLKHADLFELATGAAAETQAEQQEADDTDEILRAKKAEDEKRELDLNHLHYQVEQLDKAGLIEMGARYGVKLAKNATAEKVEEARAAIKGKIDQFGAV